MKRSEAVIEGTLKPDGTLDLDEKPELPPGRVVVVVRSKKLGEPERSVWEVLEDVRHHQEAQGVQGRSKEAIDEQINALRNEFEERQEEIDRIRRESPPNHEGAGR